MLDNNELKSIRGGFSWSILAGVGAFITLIVGIADGYLRPLKCN